VILFFLEFLISFKGHRRILFLIFTFYSYFNRPTVLATLLPVAAILSIIIICCVVYCCRKYRKRTTISKGFRNIAQFGPPTIGAGTLDRKAMLGQETSSENSDQYRNNGLNGHHLHNHHHHNHHHSHHSNLGYDNAIDHGSVSITLSCHLN